MFTLAVGEPYNPSVKSWPETVEYNFRGGMHELIISVKRPTKEEEEAFGRGAAQFALVVLGPAIFLCMRFGEQPWMDAAFTWHRVVESEREAPPEIPARLRVLLQVVVLDAANGIVRVLRTLSWTPAFSAAMHRAIRAQIEQPYPGNEAYERHCREIQARYTTPRLVEQAVIRSDAEDDPGSAQRIVEEAGAVLADADLRELRPTDRPARWLKVVHDWYPHAWQMADEFRRERGRRLPSWPTWCWLPMAGAHGIVTRDRPLAPERGHHIAIVAALAAWRAAQGLYRVDADLLGELRETPVSGALPVEALRQSPEWCPYLLLDNWEYEGKKLRGAWVHLESDIHSGREELRILLDTDDDSGSYLFPASLHLREGATLDESLEAAERAARNRAQNRGVDPDLVGEAPRDLVEPIISVYLYLCSSAAEIRNHKSLADHPRRPPSARDVHGPTSWDVGFRIGPALRDARARANEEPSHGGGMHAAPRAHVRRAHWHSFWLGPRDEPASRKLELRWLHPILVGGARDQLVPVVHEVDSEGSVPVVHEVEKEG